MDTTKSLSKPPAPGAQGDSSLASDSRALHRVLSDLVRVVQFRDRDRICCYDLSVTQCYALEAVIEQGPLTLNALSAQLYLDKSTASRVVDALVAKGYAERRPHPEDGRAVWIEATGFGRSLSRRIEADLLAEVERVVEGIEPESRRVLIDLLGRLSRAAASRVESSGGCCRLREEPETSTKGSPT